MVILGLVLLAAAAVAAVELILANDATIAVRMWHGTWHVHLYWVAVAGAVILAVGVLALAMIRSGALRSRRLRRERRDLARENERLAAERIAREPAHATPAPRQPAVDAAPAEDDDESEHAGHRGRVLHRR